MKNELFEAGYYETYYLANLINKIISDPFSFIRDLETFFNNIRDDNGFLLPFSKFSAFHQFIVFVTEEFLFNRYSVENLDVRKMKSVQFSRFAPELALELHQLPINDILSFHNIDHISLKGWLDGRGKSFEEATEDDTYEYFQEFVLDGTIDQLIERVTDEVFFIMFLNRKAMQKFNEMISQFIISDLVVEDFPPDELKVLKKDGVLKRKKIPMWVRRAVFFRDRGKCVLCNQDLSGITSRWNKEHYDHIVPLANGGLNDVTNIQLLCKKCNSQKSAKNNATSIHYERWY